MPRPIECTCQGCVSRREAQERWEAKNRERRREINRASKTRQRQRLQDSRAQVSDAELDRRALRMGL